MARAKKKRAPSKEQKKKTSVSRKARRPPAVDIRAGGPLVVAMERARDRAASALPKTKLGRVGVFLSMRTPPVTVQQVFKKSSSDSIYWRNPWVLVAKFSFSAPVLYRNLFKIFSAWENSNPIMRAIGSQRGARLVCDYHGDRGATHQFELGRHGPWGAVLSEARDRVDPDNDDGLSQAYDSTVGDISSVTVWLSAASWSEYNGE